MRNTSATNRIACIACIALVLVTAGLATAGLVGCGARGETPLGAPRVVEAPPHLPASLTASGDEAAGLAGGSPVPPAPPDPFPPAAPEAHRIAVRTGETLGLYERWSGVPQDELKAHNRFRHARSLKVGAQVSIPMTPEQAVSFARMRREFHRRREAEFFRNHNISRLVAYVVRPGESLRAISSRYSDVPRWLMEKVNQGYELSHLRPGDVVNLPIVREAPPVSPDEAAHRASVAGRTARGWSRPAEDRAAPLPFRPRTGVRVARAPLAAGRFDADVPPLPAPPPGGWRAPAAPVEEGDGWFGEDEPEDPPAEANSLFEGVRVKIRRGECLALFARWAGVPIDRIAGTNGILNPARVRIGQALRIPMPEERVPGFYERRRQHHGLSAGPGAALERFSSGGGAAAEPPPEEKRWFAYEVQRGDTAWEIASKRFRISLAALRAHNPNVDLERLGVGTVLRIPTSAIR